MSGVAPSGIDGDELIPCPWPDCQSGRILTRPLEDGQWDDAQCPVCDGYEHLTRTEADQAFERLDYCAGCMRRQDQCGCKGVGVDENVEYVTGFISRLRDLLVEGNDHGLHVTSEVYARVPGPAFDGLAAWADSWAQVSTSGTGPSLRCARWVAGRDRVDVPASEVTLIERRAA